MDNLKSITSSMNPLDITSANQSQYKLTVHGLENCELTILDFASSNHGLSDDYAFTINLKSKSAIQPQQAIMQHAMLELLWGAESVYIHGKIIELEYTGTRTDGMESYQFIVP